MSDSSNGQGTVRKSTSRSARICAATLAVAIAAIMFAPSAQATVNQLGVIPGASYGSSTKYGTGCTYTLEAILTQAVDPVYFYDNGVPIGSALPMGGIALLDWTPTTPGSHTLSAVQAPNTAVPAPVTVTVAVGNPIGWACVVTGA